MTTETTPTLSKGDYAKGVISRIEPSLEAAFVDFGEARHGFLPLGKTALAQFKQGQGVLVQIDVPATGNKGAGLSLVDSVPAGVMVHQLAVSEMQGARARPFVLFALMVALSLGVIAMFSFRV